METINIQAPVKTSAVKLWVGRIMSWICIAFLLVDSIMKIIMNHYSVDGTIQLGFGEHTVQPIGLVLLICTVLYMVPRTWILGAILLTGYFGGAIATMVRSDQSFVFPLVFAALIWGGILLRDERVKSLL
jgi:hypothetical protein